MKEKNFYEKIFKEIKEGVSEVKNEETSFFIKHPTSKEFEKLNENYDFYYSKSEKRGALTEEKLLEFLDEQGVWTKDKEKQINELEIEVKNLIKTKNKLIVKKEKDAFDDNIKTRNKQLKDLQKERNKFVKNTVEDYASRKSNEMFVFSCIYEDSNLVNKKYSEEQLNYMEISDLNKIHKIYREYSDKFSSDNILQLSIEPIFYNIFNLFGSDLSRFFNEFHLDWSIYKVNLLNNAKMFRNIFENKEIPNNIKNNAKKILEHIDQTEEAKTTAERAQKKASSGGGFSYKGATREDLKKAGINTEGALDIHAVAEKKGKKGELTMEDFMEIHGK